MFVQIPIERIMGIIPAAGERRTASHRHVCAHNSVCLSFSIASRFRPGHVAISSLSLSPTNSVVQLFAPAANRNLTHVSIYIAQNKRFGKWSDQYS